MKRKLINTELIGGISKMFKKLNKKIAIKSAVALATMTMFATNVYALPGDGGAMTDQLITEILVWVQRIGAVMTVCSVVSFGFAWKSDDAEAKSRSIQFFIASAIILSTKTILGVMGIV